MVCIEAGRMYIFQFKRSKKLPFLLKKGYVLEKSKALTVRSDGLGYRMKGGNFRDEMPTMSSETH
jgi:hypothetical protein